MYIADLVWEGVVIKTIPLQDFNFIIQICKPQSISLRELTLNQPLPEDIVEVDIMQFEFRERGMDNHLKYYFKKYVIKPTEIDDKPLNIGFDSIPENFNLDALKNKLKKGINLKNLLLRFYQK